MLKKRMMILGLAGVLATGFGVAGCSGSSNVVDGTETAEIVNVTETIGQVEESSVAEVVTDFVETESTTTFDTLDTSGKHIYTILNGQLEVPLETDVYKYIETIDGFEYYDIFTLAKDLGWEPTSTPDNQAQKWSRVYTYSADGYDMEVWMEINRHGDLTAAKQTASYGFDISGLRDGKGRDIRIENYAGSIYRTRMDHSISIDYAVLMAYTFEHMKEEPGVDPMYDLLINTGLLDTINSASLMYAFDNVL